MKLLFGYDDKHHIYYIRQYQRRLDMVELGHH